MGKNFKKCIVEECGLQILVLFCSEETKGICLGNSSWFHGSVTVDGGRNPARTDQFEVW